MSPQHPTYPPKFCSDTSTSKNYWGCFNKQVRLDEDVDIEMFQTPDDCLVSLKGVKVGSKVLRNRLLSLFKIATLHLKEDQQDSSARKLFSI